MNRNGLLIHGHIVRPCFSSLEDMSKHIKASHSHVDFNFLESYNDHLAHMEFIAICAKIFIVENWEKVTDWSDISIDLVDTNEDVISFFKHEPSTRESDDSSYSRLLKSIDDYSASKHNPVNTLTNVHIDPTDGDFAVEVNGKEFWPLRDEDVIIIANYIEEQLEK